MAPMPPPSNKEDSSVWTLEVLLTSGGKAAFKISAKARRRVETRLVNNSTLSRPADFVTFDCGNARVAIDLSRLVEAKLEPAQSDERTLRSIAPGVLRVWMVSLPEPVDLKIVPGQIETEESPDHRAARMNVRDVLRLDEIYPAANPANDGLGVLHVRKEFVAMTEVAQSTLQNGALRQRADALGAGAHPEGVKDRAWHRWETPSA